MCKVGDGNPLRRWRVSVEVPATPNDVLQRLLRERPLWQIELQQEKVLETLDKQTDVYHYSCYNMAPQPSCDYVVLRSELVFMLRYMNNKRKLNDDSYSHMRCVTSLTVLLFVCHLRSWRTELCKGSCALVCVSVEHDDSPRTGAVRGVVLESQYLLEPCGTGRTRLTHISRVDLRLDLFSFPPSQSFNQRCSY